jgi:hypothetical protein
MPSEDSIDAYRKALKAMENHDRPSDYLGLTDENRKEAGIRHVEIFAQTSWPLWRTYKVHMINRLLDDREALIEDVAKTFPEIADRAKSVTYQEVTNGLMGSAIAEYCQSVEDLAAIIYAIKDVRYFARNVNYDAGRIQNIVKKWAKGVSRNEFLTEFNVPKLADTDFDGDKESLEQYNSCIRQALETIQKISVLYLTLLPHQIAYKHGMSYALRPFGNDLSEENIAKKMVGKTGYPMIFANNDLPQAMSEYNFRGVLQCQTPSIHILDSMPIN